MSPLEPTPAPRRPLATLSLTLGLLAVGCNGVELTESAEMGPPGEGGGGGDLGGWRPTSGPLPEPTEAQRGASYLIRLIPKRGGGAGVIYCAATQLSSNLLITAGSCFERGVGFAEVFSGATIDLSYSQPGAAPRAVSVVESVYMPGNYERASGKDVALVKIVTPLTTPPAVYSPLGRAAVSGFVRVGYRESSVGVFEQVAVAAAPREVFSESLLFGAGTAEICPVPGGGVFFQTPSGQTALVGVNARGSEACVEEGVAVRLDSNESFVLNATMSAPTLAGGETGLVIPALTCAQTFLCHSVPCQQMVVPAHQALRDTLFLCGHAQGCLSASCYPTVCPQDYTACLEAPPPTVEPTPPMGGGMGGGMGGVMGGGMGGQPSP